MHASSQTTGTPSIEALDWLSGVVASVDEEHGSAEFFSRLAKGVCDLARMDRAVIFSYDDARRRVNAVGAHGVALDKLTAAYITVESAPVARRALTDDVVVEVLAHEGHAISEEFSELVGDHALVYVPIVAAKRWIGVIIAEPAAGVSPIDAALRERLGMLGKTLALAYASRIATSEAERAHELEGRINLAREIHDSVSQRLFGVSLALRQPLTAEAHERCAAEVGEALSELRSALQRPLRHSLALTGTTLAAELERLSAEHPDLGLCVEGEVADVPPGVEALAQSVLTEAVRNARKHADARRLLVRAHTRADMFVLEIENDGVPAQRRASTGVGLRLAALAALQAGGLVEFGQRGPGTWQVRLVVPLASQDAE